MKHIQELVNQIAERFHPERVILFGSHAYGTPTGDSDVDLLVVMEIDGNPLHAAALVSGAIDHPFPLDILVIKPRDLARALKDNNVFESEVITKGITIYEATDQGVDQQGGR